MLRKSFMAVAAEEPIYDYHCHLDPEEIAQDRQWDNLAEVWLAGDHYQWRALTRRWNIGKIHHR